MSKEQIIFIVLLLLVVILAALIIADTAQAQAPTPTPEPRPVVTPADPCNRYNSAWRWCQHNRRLHRPRGRR